MCFFYVCRLKDTREKKNHPQQSKNTIKTAIFFKTLRPAFLPVHSVVCADELSSPQFGRLRDSDCRLRDPDCRLRPPNDGFRSLASPNCRLRSFVVCACRLTSPPTEQLTASKPASPPEIRRLRSRHPSTVVSATPTAVSAAAARVLSSPRRRPPSPRPPPRTVVSAAATRKQSSPLQNRRLRLRAATCKTVVSENPASA